MTATDKARLFAALHRPGDPLILYNAWDAGSARAVAEAGAKAIATGSASVAAAQGLRDAEGLPLELALANADGSSRRSTLPVTIDFEGGYAVEPEAVAANVAGWRRPARSAAISRIRSSAARGLHPIAMQAERIRAIRAAVGPDFFINARTDIFLQAKPDSHDEAMVDAALARAPRPMPKPARAASSCRCSPISLCWSGSARPRLCRSISWPFRGAARRPRWPRRGWRGSATGRSRSCDEGAQRRRGGGDGLGMATPLASHTHEPAHPAFPGRGDRARLSPRRAGGARLCDPGADRDRGRSPCSPISCSTRCISRRPGWSPTIWRPAP